MKVLIKEDFKESVKSLDKYGKKSKGILLQNVFRALTLIEAEAKKNIRTKLNVRSGTLLNSIQKEVNQKGDLIEGKVGPENVPYAGTHEFGAKMPARFVKPRNTLALKFSVGNKVFFSKGHKIPSFEIPARPYLRPAAEKVADIVEKELGLTIEKELDT